MLRSSISRTHDRADAISAEFRRAKQVAQGVTLSAKSPLVEIATAFREYVKPIPDDVRAFLNVPDAVLWGVDRHCRDLICGVETPSLLGLARVMFEDDDVFDFVTPASDPANARDAIIGICQDAEGRPCDLFAWSIGEGIIAAFRGRAGVNSERESFQLRTSSGLLVHRTPLEWLRANRRGVFLLDLGRAAPVLRNAGPLIVESLHFGRVLREKLCVAPPTIIISSDSSQVAA